MKSTKYIGGEYALNDLDNYLLSEKHEIDNYFPTFINEKSRSFFETGTDALAYIISNKCKNIHPIQLWIPDNYCFETIERLKLKLAVFDININKINRYLTLDEIKVEANSFNCILLLHYNCYKILSRNNFGDNCFTIEDFVQAPLDIKKSKSDFAINSLRKISNLEIAVAYIDPAIIEYSFKKSSYFEYKKKATLLKTTFFKTLDDALEKEYLELFRTANTKLFDPVVQFANRNEIERISEVNFDALIKKRRENYQYLKNKISSIKELQILEGDYMYLMIFCEKRDQLKKFLAKQNIFTAIHWADSESSSVENYLSLHIDHRYDFDDLDRVIIAINEFYAKN